MARQVLKYGAIVSWVVFVFVSILTSNYQTVMQVQQEKQKVEVKEIKLQKRIWRIVELPPIKYYRMYWADGIRLRIRLDNGQEYLSDQQGTLYKIERGSWGQKDELKQVERIGDLPNSRMELLAEDEEMIVVFRFSDSPIPKDSGYGPPR